MKVWGRIGAVALVIGGVLTLFGAQLAAQPEPLPRVDCGTNEGGAFVGSLNSNTTEFVVQGGLQVILKRTAGNPVVAVHLFIDGGSRNQTAENTGIEQLTLGVAAEGGSTSMSKLQMSELLNSMGSGVGSSTSWDYSKFNMSSLLVYFAETWAIYRDVLRNPGFPETELELQRERQLTSIRTRLDDPDSQVTDLARQLMFQGHPYLLPPEGELESVEAFTRADLVTYYHGLMDTSRMVLVIVGDLDQAQVEAVIGDTFAGLPNSSGRPDPPSGFPSAPSTLAFEEADIPTNYIFGLAPGPHVLASDYAAMVMATEHLRDRLFEEVRTVRNLSYAVSAGLSFRLANYTYLYVTAVDPEATLPVMGAEVLRLQEELITSVDLEQIIQVYVTGYYMHIDSNGAIAHELGWWEFYGGGRNNADSYIQRLRDVTPEDVQQAARTYLRRYQFGVVGHAEQNPPRLYGVGE